MKTINYYLRIFFIFFLFACSSEEKNVVTIGHRGAMGHVTENTIPSIQKAIELGVDGIEIDVFKCKSGEIVLFHDKKLDRLTSVKGFIENIDIDSINKIKIKDQYKIPLLEEVLEIVPENIFLNIELKGKGTAKKVNEILLKKISNNSSKMNNYIISSFDWDELNILRSINKNIPLAILTSNNIDKAILEGKKINATSINPNYKLLDKKNILQIKSEGFKVFPYTVNDQSMIEKMKKLRVDGIITDYPERVNSKVIYEKTN